MISFHRSRKFSSYIVRVKLYLLEKTVGSCKYGKKRCDECDIISEAGTLTSENLIVVLNVLYATCKIHSIFGKLQTALDLSGINTNLKVESLIKIKNVRRNIFTVILKMRDVTVF